MWATLRERFLGGNPPVLCERAGTDPISTTSPAADPGRVFRTLGMRPSPSGRRGKRSAGTIPFEM